MTNENITLALQYALNTEKSDRHNSEITERITNSLVVADSIAADIYNNKGNDDKVMALWKQLGTIQHDFNRLENILSTFYEMLNGNIGNEIEDPKKLGAMIREYAGKELA